jgi:D-glycero-D-manno-heptose 1,7-bisphosphate phosphatase
LRKFFRNTVTTNENGVRHRAVFVDRDGTLNVEKDYLFRIEDFEFIPGVPDAIRRLRQAGFLVIVVTNQSGVARGYFSLSEADALHRHIQDELKKAATCIDGFYVCPHHPTEGVGELRRACKCRKGEPGMLLRAAAERGIDLSASFMVGDKVADIDAGERAGCTSLLVLTGYGKTEAVKLSERRVLCFPDLAAAADHILTARHSPSNLKAAGGGKR